MGTFRFIGTEALIAKGMAALPGAVNECAEHLVSAAQAAAPVVTGTLRGSIHTDGAEVSGGSVVAKVQTGGESSAYAAVVHEGHRSDGSYPRAAGPAKFLEKPLLENRHVYLEIMARAMKGAY